MPAVFGSTYESLPPWYQNIIRKTLEETEALRRQEYPRYEEPRIAALPPYMQKSYELATRTGLHEPYLKEASRLLHERRPYAEQIETYMNPYQKHVLEGISREGEKTFKERILPALEAKFVNLGQHGSSRHRGMSERMARDLQSEILHRQQEAMHRGYSEASQLNLQEKLRNIEAARALGGLGMQTQRASQEEINLLNSLGAQQQAQRQQELNERQAEFWRRAMWPHQQLAQQASMIHGVPIPTSGSTFMSYQPPQPVPQLNRTGQMGSMAAQLYGLGQMQGGFKRGGHIGLSKLKLMRKKKRRAA